MEKRQKIIAFTAVFGLVGLLVLTAPSSKQNLSTRPTSDLSTASATDTSPPQQQSQTSNSTLDDLNKKIADEQAQAKQDKANAQKYLDSANSISSPVTTSVPSYDSSAPTFGNTPSPNSGCNFSAAQSAMQAADASLYAQYRQIGEQISQLNGQISTLKNSYGSSGSKWGYSGSGYDANYTNTLNSYEQQLSALNSQEQSVLSQIQSADKTAAAPYGC